MMYFVGGGMVQGHPLDTSIPQRVIPQTRIPIFGVNFRKCVTSATAFPGALQDAISAFVFLLERGCRAENISIMGDSGRGGISITFLLYLIKHKLPMPECAVLVSPFVDLCTKFDGKGEGGEEEKKDMMLDSMNHEMFGTVGFQYTENRPESRGTLLSPSRGRLPKGYGYRGFCWSMIVYGDAEAFSSGKLFDHFQFVLPCQTV